MVVHDGNTCAGVDEKGGRSLEEKRYASMG